jgi:hypothetical protein
LVIHNFERGDGKERALDCSDLLAKVQTAKPLAAKQEKVDQAEDAEGEKGRGEEEIYHRDTEDTEFQKIEI